MRIINLKHFLSQNDFKKNINKKIILIKILANFSTCISKTDQLILSISPYYVNSNIQTINPSTYRTFSEETHATCVYVSLIIPNYILYNNAMLVYTFDLELIFDIGNNVDISKVVIYIEKKIVKNLSFLYNN